MRALVVGAGSGIGAALVDVLSRDNRYSAVHAVVRRPVSAVDRRVCWHHVEAPIASASALRQGIPEGLGPFDRAYVTVGLLNGEEARPEKALAQITEAGFVESSTVNALLPLLYAGRCVELARRGGDSRVLVLSAKVGSIGDNQLGGWYGYRMAKAALNMGLKCLAIESSRKRAGPRTYSRSSGNHGVCVIQSLPEERPAGACVGVGNSAAPGGFVGSVGTRAPRCVSSLGWDAAAVVNRVRAVQTCPSCSRARKRVASV